MESEASSPEISSNPGNDEENWLSYQNLFSLPIPFITTKIKVIEMSKIQTPRECRLLVRIGLIGHEIDTIIKYLEIELQADGCT